MMEQRQLDTTGIQSMKKNKDNKMTKYALIEDEQLILLLDKLLELSKSADNFLSTDSYGELIEVDAILEADREGPIGEWTTYSIRRRIEQIKNDNFNYVKSIVEIKDDISTSKDRPWVQFSSEWYSVEEGSENNND